MRYQRNTAVLSLCIFFVLVFVTAYLFNPHYPMLILAGEGSVGTWMSGVLLIISATLSLIIGMRRGWIPWIFVFAFFMILALDERFMFHERCKEWIIFSFSDTTTMSRWVYEMPVIAGAFFGSIVSFKLWQHFQNSNRVLLAVATLFGLASVAIDIFTAGVFWEDCFKLLAELSLACALIREANR